MTKLEPMGIGDILDTAFRLCRRRFGTFVAIASVVCVPSSIAAAFVIGAARLFMPAEQPDDDGLLNVVSASLPRGNLVQAGLSAAKFAQLLNAQSFRTGLGMIASVALGVAVFSLVLSVAYPLCTGALVMSVSASYLGETIGAGQSYLRAFGKLWRLLMAQAWTTLLVLLGLCLCVVPGVFLFFQLLVVPEVVLLEDQKAWPAIGRSRALMADHLGKAFVLTAVMSLLGLIIGTTIDVAVHFVPWPFAIIGDFLSYFLLQIVMLPLSIATAVLFYYDVRIRKEAFDLQHLATHMVEFRAP